MDLILSSILFGILGGIVRALVGIVKYFEKNKKEGKLRFSYFTFTLFVAAVVGGLAGALANHNWRLAVIAGQPEPTFWKSCTKSKRSRDLKFDAPTPQLLRGGR